MPKFGTWTPDDEIEARKIVNQFIKVQNKPKQTSSQNDIIIN